MATLKELKKAMDDAEVKVKAAKDALDATSAADNDVFAAIDDLVNADFIYLDAHYAHRLALKKRVI